VFGVPAGLLTCVIVSLLTAAPDDRSNAFVDYLRDPQ
jgi:cation/acetate symporter